MADALIVDVVRSFPTGVRIEAQFSAAASGGAVIVLFGPSGSGKTTIVRAIAGLDRPDRGIIRFGDETWFEGSAEIFVEPQRRRVGFVFQEAALFPHLTVCENVGYGLDGLRGSVRRRRSQAMLELLGAEDLADRYPRQLSGGQSQRVALARALAPHPRLIVLDEPFASLDTPTRAQLRKLLRQAVGRLGIACVLVTHDRTEAIAIGDALVVLAEGRVRQVGSVSEVFRRPADLAVARSVGVESVVAAHIVGVHDGLVELRAEQASLRAVDVGRDPRSQEVYVCIRAEDVTLEQVEGGVGSARNHLPGRVLSIEPEGPVERVNIDCGFPLVALITRHAREEMRLAEGSLVNAAIKATAVHLVDRF